MLCSDSLCTGCMACANACVRGAIATSRNAAGFYRPAVDAARCVDCGACTRACPLTNPLPKLAPLRVFAAWHRDAAVREQSSSGGAFSALAAQTLAEGGVVVGAAYDGDMRVRHTVVDSVEGLARLRGSKYVQSDVGLTYRQVRGYLRGGRRVLFCGTPCQAAALLGYLGGERKGLVVCDFICHGVPSPAVFHGYVEGLRRRLGRITAINFRDKRKGWYDALRVAATERGPRVLRGASDAYMTRFYANRGLQPSCYACQMLGLERRADITLADFWGVKGIGGAQHGVSAVVCCTPRGVALVQAASQHLHAEERTIEEVASGNHTLTHGTARPTGGRVAAAKTLMIRTMREWLPRSVMLRIRGYE